MGFEYDQSKSASNNAKHGIDFQQAQALWLDINVIQIASKVVTDEPRFIVIGMIGEKHWTAAITYRGENVRIISVRRSRDEEIEIHEG